MRNAWTPAIALLAALALLPVSARGQGYAQSITTYNFIPTAGHTVINAWPGTYGCPDTTGDDSLSAPINIGFNFQFGNTTYTQLQVFTNGRLQFNNSYCYYGTLAVGPPRTYPNPMPDANTNNTIRIYGVDFSVTAGGTITYATLGVAPNRTFVVTWNNVPQWTAAGSSYNVQVQLQESGNFLFMYGNSVNASGGTTLGPGDLGWQLSTTSFWAQTGLPATGTAYLFTPIRPALSVQKTSVAFTDPQNGSTNPKRIPGGVVRYLITTTNTGNGPVDASTLVIMDPVPPNTDLYVSGASGNPVEFLDGNPASGLAFNYAANVGFSKQPGGGPPFTYVPVPDAAGFDPLVTGFSVSPTGVMSAASAAGQPSFTIRFRVRIH